jgi:hypothetical protein
MAKKASIMRLVSQAGTGYFYTFRKVVKSGGEKCASLAHLAHTPTCPLRPALTLSVCVLWP